MLRSFKYPRKGFWISTAVGAVGPGVVAAGLEYFFTDGVRPWQPLLWALAGGVAALASLWLVSMLWSNEAVPTDGGGRMPAEGTQQNQQPSIVLPTSALRQVHPGPQPNASIESAALESGMNQPSVVFSPRTPTEIVEELDGHTEVVQQRLIGRHIGLWIEISGAIRNVSLRGPDSYFTVTVRDSQSEITFFLEFNVDEWLQMFEASNIGDRISARGEIARINAFPRYEAYFTLGQCVLIEALNPSNLEES